MTNGKMEIQFNDGLMSGDRKPTLWILAEGLIHKFCGENIPRVAVILADVFNKNGKWSSTDFSLRLAEGARGITLVAALHGKVWPQASAAAARAEVCPEIEQGQFDLAVQRDFPKTWERWERNREALEALG